MGSITVWGAQTIESVYLRVDQKNSPNLHRENKLKRSSRVCETTKHPTFLSPTPQKRRKSIGLKKYSKR